MSFTFRPAVRGHTPLIIGIAGPTKSGKTYSAHRLARGLAGGKPVAMLNAEGPRGHQYADKFEYLAADLEAPFRYTRYVEAIHAMKAMDLGCAIIDSASHGHDGPGGTLEWHEEILDRIAGKDYKRRQSNTFTAWVEPKTAENQFIYALLELTCPVILCFRAKEKIKITKGEVIELGWQPIVGERVAFETIFTLMLPPGSKGVPDLLISDMREPFDTMIQEGQPIDEELGERLAAWAKGGGTTQKSSEPSNAERSALLGQIMETMTAFIPAELSVAERKAQGAALQKEHFGTSSWTRIQDPKQTPLDTLRDGLAALQERLAALQATDPELATEGKDVEPDEEMAGSEGKLSDTLI